MLTSGELTLRTLQSSVRSALEEHRVPGVVAAVRIGDEVAQAAAGSTDLHASALMRTDPMRTDTRLRVASLTKPMVATVVVQLAARGLLSLDDRIRRHLPAFTLSDEAAADQVTVRDVLSHRGGWLGDFMPTQLPDDAQSFPRHTALMRELPQLTPPGTLMSYCNSGYALLGHLCEAVSGEPFEELMQHVLFDPLGMSGARVGVDEPVAPGHARRGSHYVRVSDGTESLPRFSASVGGVTATVADVALFAQAFARSTGATASLHLLEEMLVPHADSVGTQNLADQIALGWMLRNDGETQLLSHTGDTLGHHMLAVAIPRFEFACAVGVNAQGGDQAAEDVVRHTFSALTGAAVPDARYAEPETSAEAAQHVVGRYESSLAVTTVTCSQPPRVTMMVERKPLPMGVAESFELTGTLFGDVIALDSRDAGGRVRVVRGADAAVTQLRIEGRLAERIA